MAEYKPFLPWRTDGDRGDWTAPSHDTAGISTASIIVDQRGEVVAFAVGTGWGDEDADRRKLIISAVNEHAALVARSTQDAETIQALRDALTEARTQVQILQDRLGIKDTGCGTLSIIDAALASQKETQ